MNEPSKTMWERSTIRWLFQPRQLRIALCAVVCLVTLVGLCYVVINWSGKHAWDKYRLQMEAQGERIQLSDFVPPPVPDDQNFAMTPFLKPLFDFLPGTQTYRDTNAIKSLYRFAERCPDWPVRTWRFHRKIDLPGWLKWLKEFNEHSRPKTATSASTNAVDRAPAAEAVLAALKEYEPVLAELRAASRRPQCRFNIRYEEENPVGILLPHLSVLKKCVKILALRASAELALGRTDAAFQDLDQAFYLANASRSEPFLISQLVRIAQAQLVIQPLWEGLAERQWTDDQLQAFQDRLQKFDFVADCTRSLQAERAFGNAIMAYARNNPKVLADGSVLEREVGSTPSSLAVALAQSHDLVGLLDVVGSTPSSLAVALAQAAPRGWFYREQLNYNRCFPEFLQPGITTHPPRFDPPLIQQNADRLAKTLENKWAVIRDHRLACSLLLPAIANSSRRFANAQTVVNQAAIACALERYRRANGSFPETLEALAPGLMKAVPRDVIGGEPLPYRRTDNGQYLLYSVGWNVKDDGGEVGLGKNGQWDIQQGDWVWRY